MPAELKLIGMLGETGDDRGRDIPAERRADLVHLLALLTVKLADARQKHEAGGKAGNDGVEEDPVPGERVPAEIGQATGGDARRRARSSKWNERKKRGQREGKRGAGHELGPRRPVRPLQSDAGEDLLDELRMRLDPRRRWIERCRDNVGKQRGACANKHELAGEIGEIGVGPKDFPGRDRAARVGLGEPHAQLAVSLNPNHHVPDLDRLEARALARRASIGGRGFHDIARRALGDAQRLDRQTRLDLAVDVEQERHAANDAVVVRQPVEKTEAARSVRKSGNWNKRSLQLVEEGHRRVADERKTRLRRKARLRAIVTRVR